MPELIGLCSIAISRFFSDEWTAADGSHLKLKRSLKVAYENYTKAGDRERALADPMLRHPD